MNSVQMTLIMFVTAASLNVWARVDLKQTQLLILPKDTSTPFLSENDKNKIIPNSIHEEQTATEVLAQMADNTFSLWWETTPLRHTAVGKAADEAEKKLNVKAEYEDKNKVKHAFNFKVLAMQALARIEYKGWVRAAISYDARAAKTEAEVSEKLNTNQDLVISQSITTAESKSQIGLRWSW
jgi:hypothetical protein